MKKSPNSTQIMSFMSNFFSEKFVRKTNVGPFQRLLTEDDAQSLMKNKLEFSDVTLLGKGCFGTTYSVMVTSQPEVSSDSKNSCRKMAVCKAFLFGKEWNKDSIE